MKELSELQNALKACCFSPDAKETRSVELSSSTRSTFDERPGLPPSPPGALQKNSSLSSELREVFDFEQLEQTA
uniref:Uncharacterized protein n=1 Tax=Strongyloides papillosus TaxID=174720 RepID=A0A0N5CC22_STREA